MHAHICTAYPLRCAVFTEAHILTALTRGNAEYSHIHVYTARPLGPRALMMFGIKYGWQGIGNVF